MNGFTFIFLLVCTNMRVVEGQRIISWTSLTVGTTPPAPYTSYTRAGHQAVADPEGKGYFVFGGETMDTIDGANYDKNLWYFDVETAAWSLVQTVTPGPSARAYYTFATIGSSSRYAVLYGGEAPNVQIVFDDVWLLDLVALDWIQPAKSNTSLAVNPVRKKHVMFYHEPSSLFYIHGGRDTLGDRTELFSLSLAYNSAQRTWSYRFALVRSQGPCLRSHTAVSVTESSSLSTGGALIFGGLELFSGQAASIASSSLYRLTLLRNGSATWSESYNVTGQPSSRFGHAATFNNVTREMWITGGSTTPFAFNLLVLPSWSDVSSWYWRIGPNLKSPAYYHSMVALPGSRPSDSIMVKYGGKVNANPVQASEMIQYVWAGQPVDFSPDPITLVVSRTWDEVQTTVMVTQTHGAPLLPSKVFGVLDRQMQIVLFGAAMAFMVLLIATIFMTRHWCGRKKLVKSTSQGSNTNFYNL